MTIADFLAQAGFWQWVGMIFLVGAAASFRPVTIQKCRDEEKTP